VYCCKKNFGPEIPNGYVNDGKLYGVIFIGTPCTLLVTIVYYVTVTKHDKNECLFEINALKVLSTNSSHSQLVYVIWRLNGNMAFSKNYKV